jgi:hypothetical protein
MLWGTQQMFMISLVRLWLTGCNLHMSVVVIFVPIELSMISTGRNLHYCLCDPIYIPMESSRISIAPYYVTLLIVISH